MNETIVEQVEADHDTIAYTRREAAARLRIGYSTLSLEVAARRIFPTRLGMFSREELLRYLREETELRRRSRRARKTTTV